MKKSSVNKKNTNLQGKYFLLLLYTDWEQLDILLKYITSISKNYAYIKHDKDLEEDNTPKKVHIHCVIEMSARRTINGLFQLLCNQCPGLKINLIEIAFNPNSSIRYLTHIDYPEKHQYNYNEIITNNQEWLKELYQIETDDISAYKIIVDFLQNNEKKIELIDIGQLSLEKNFFKFYKNKTYLIKQLIYEHNLKVQNENEISFKVDREVVKAIGKVKRENDVIYKLGNTFDKFQVESETGEIIELMNTGVKRKK